MKSFIKEHPIVFCFLITVFIIFLFYLIERKIYEGNADQADEAALVNYILVFSISLALVIIAYIKIDEANRQARLNYLLRVDDRWASSEIILAREVIHLLYLDTYKIPPENKTCKERRFIIGQGIKCLNFNRDKVKEFISLLNFLDFLETIGYIYFAKGITLIEIRELLGNSIVFYYEIFEDFIEFRRTETNDKKFYEHFERLYKEVKNYKEPQVEG